MTRHRSLFSIARKNLLEMAARPDPADPFRPLDQIRRRRFPRPFSLTAPVGPAAQNRTDDVRGVDTALKRAGILDREERPGRDVFDSRLDTGIRTFQRRNRLKVDGLLLPGGPTQQALNPILRRATAKRPATPPPAGLSGAAVAANARLVRHLMGTTADGMVPDLMAGDFRHGREGRAKTADFLSQLFARDPVRARSLRAKARGMMAADEKSLLDRLILQARLADEDPGQDDPEEPEDPTPDDPGQDDPDEPPDEPDDPEKPEKPEKPKPDCQAIIDALRALIKELNEVRKELARKKKTFDANKARITELEKEQAGLKARRSILFNAQRLAAQSGSVATQTRIAARVVEINKRLAEIEIKLKPLRKENEALEPEIDELKERERQKEENQRILEARLEECRAQGGGD